MKPNWTCPGFPDTSDGAKVPRREVSWLTSTTFKPQVGFNRLNRVFGGKLEKLLGDLQEEVWRDVA